MREIEFVFQEFKSSIVWTCPRCECVNEQCVVVPDFNLAAESPSDMSTDGEIEITCDECGVVYTGDVWSHPHGTDFEIKTPEAFSFSGDLPMYEPSLEDYEPPSDPYSIASEAMDLLGAMVGAPSPGSDAQFTNRLIFAGAVASMEAYLSDTLINAVRADPAVRTQLIRRNKKLSELKVTAGELAADPDVLEKLVVSELRAVLYHNLKAVTALYRDAFAMDVAPSQAVRDILFPAMNLRHHCVHRNGCDESGARIEKFTDAYVREVIDAIRSLLQHIEREKAKPASFDRHSFAKMIDF